MYENWITSISVLNGQKNVRDRPKSAAICSNHFSPDNFIPGAVRKRLKENAVPTIFPDNNKM